MNRVILSPEYFPNPTIGRPISGAQIFVGIVDLDPEIEANQKQVSVQQESGVIVDVDQPVLTGAGGVPLHQGSPVTILVSGDYSLKVLNKQGAQIYYVPSQEGFPTGSFVDDMLGLLNITGQGDGDRINMTAFFYSSPQPEFSGGGSFAWQEDLNKNLANGGTVIDPDTPGGFDGTESTRDAFLTAQGSGVGTGCWVRLSNAVDIAYFGAIDDDTSDNYIAIRSSITAVPTGGILNIEGDIFKTSNEVLLKSDMTVNCTGTIKLTGKTDGGSLIAPYGISNVLWNGGILDANSMTGENVIGIAGNVVPCKNVTFKNLKVKNALHDVSTLGGKGFTIHQDCTEIRYLNIVAEDCSIGFAVEGFDIKPIPTNIIDGIIVRRATRMAVWLVQGGATGLDDSRNFSCIIDNIEIEDCDISATSGFALIGCDRASNIQGHFKISNRSVTTPVIVIKGTIANSRLVIDADLNNCQDLIDARSLLDGQPTADSFSNVIDIRANIAGASSGFWTRLNTGVNDISESDITIRAKNFGSVPISNSAYPSTIRFDYGRLEDAFRISGRTNTIPAFDTGARERLYTLSASVIDELELTFSTGGQVAIIRPFQSSFELDIRNGADETVILTKTPGVSETAISLRYNDGSTEKLGSVTVGASDSGGAGTRLLRVPN